MICDSGLERPEIRPAPLSDLHHPVQKGDMPAALPPAPFILSPVMLAGFLRGHHETHPGQRWLCHQLLCFLWVQETFSPVLLCLHLQSLPQHAPPCKSPCPSSPGSTSQHCTSGGATAPLQGHGQLSTAKCSLGPSNSVGWDSSMSGDGQSDCLRPCEQRAYLR